MQVIDTRELLMWSASGNLQRNYELATYIEAGLLSVVCQRPTTLPQQQFAHVYICKFPDPNNLELMRAFSPDEGETLAPGGRTEALKVIVPTQ